MHNVCPGAKSFRQPKPEIFTCPYCGAEVEIWTDELKGVCPNCKKTVYKEQNLSCVEWCKLAKECVGVNLYNQYIENRNRSIKNNLLKELTNNYGNNLKLINHTKKVLKYAEQLLRKEKGDWNIIVPAAILHDIGVKVTKGKNDSSKEKYQKNEGPLIAKKILLRFGLNLEYIKEICEIIAYHQCQKCIDSVNFKIFYDAHLLSNFKDKTKSLCKSELKQLINKLFFTNTAKQIAEKMCS